jgi:hypothetical protein
MKMNRKIMLNCLCTDEHYDGRIHDIRTINEKITYFVFGSIIFGILCK